MDDTPQPGQLLARGVARYLQTLNFSTLLEFVPTSGLRVDVMAIGPKGEIWIIECKSSKADFQSDTKWHGYLEWCDQYFWAVSPDFPTDLLPTDTGLIFADAYGAEMIRDAPKHPLPAPRRKKITLKYARNAAQRLQTQIDPRG
jgi:hypothetical protein